MVKIMENPIKMDDLGGKTHPYFWFNTHLLHPTCQASISAANSCAPKGSAILRTWWKSLENPYILPSLKLT